MSTSVVQLGTGPEPEPPQACGIGRRIRYNKDWYNTVHILMRGIVIDTISDIHILEYMLAGQILNM